MDGHSKDIIKFLTQDSVFSKGRYQSLARLLPHICIKEVGAGEIIYKSGSPADNLYFLIKGEARFITGQGKKIGACAGNRLGEETGTDFKLYISDAVAVTAVTVMIVPKESLLTFLSDNPNLKIEFYSSLMRIFSGEEICATSGNRTKKGSQEISKLKDAGWLLTIAVPAVIIWFGPTMGLPQNSILFLSIFSASIVMWIFTLVDEYVPGLFALLATLVMGLAPTNIILSGFASDGFFMAMSFLGLGTVVVASGLSYRFLLVLLRRLPNKQFWHNIGLLLTGFLLTPMVPSINGRVALVAPFYTDMTDILRLQPMGRAATRLAIATFTGAGLMSGVFLSSKSVNFIIFGLLPSQLQEQFQWVFWFKAAAVTGAAMLVLYLIFAGIFYRNKEAPQFSKEQITLQLDLMGRIKAREWTAIAGIMMFVFGIITFSIHKIQPPWLGLSVLFGLLLLGSLNKKEFKEKIDWPFLMYTGEVVGIVAVFNYLGIDKWLAAHLAAFGEYMHADFGMFVLILAGIIFILRLAVPISAAIVITATVFMPIAEEYGVNAWLVGFIILIIGEMWIFPYQCSYYMQFERMAGKKQVYNEKSFLRFNLLMNIIKIAAIYASIPYWKMLGIL